MTLFIEIIELVLVTYKIFTFQKYLFQQMPTTNPESTNPEFILILLFFKSCKLWKKIRIRRFSIGCWHLTIEFTTCFHGFSEYESTNFSTKYYLIFVFIFSNNQNWDFFFWPIRNLFCLFNWEILVKQIRRFVLGKFVKTCRELNNRFNNPHLYIFQQIHCNLGNNV